MKKKLKKRIMSMLLSICMIVTVLPANVSAAAEEPVQNFGDVKQEDWFAPAVNYVYEHGIMSGYGGNFTPYANISRAMVVETLYKMQGKPYAGKSDIDYTAYDGFKDLKRTDWWSESVAWALNEGIATGDIYNHTFTPNSDVTREQLSAFIYRYTEYAGSKPVLSGSVDNIIGDAPVSSWAKTEFAWAIEQKLISGLASKDAQGNTVYDLSPRTGATRAQTATILQRFSEAEIVKPNDPDISEDTTIKVAVLEQNYEFAMWKEVCEAFTDTTGIKVELEQDKYIDSVLQSSIENNDYPDVVYLPIGRESGITEQMIKEKELADITDVLSMKVPGENALVSEKIAGGFAESTLTNPYGDGKTYLAPMFYEPCGLFYNAGLFEEKGWDVPKTWDEMWELGDKAAQEGIALFTYPTTGYLDAFFYCLLYSAGGAEFFNSAACYKEGIWETKEAEACFDVVEKLLTYVHEDTAKNANDQDFKKNQQLVLDNEALFMPNGSWIIGEMKDADRADGFKWGVTAVPSVDKDGDRYAYSWMNQAWIPSKAENIDAAKKFIAYLYSDEACEIFAWYGAAQPVVGVSDFMTAQNLQNLKKVCSVYDDGAKAALGSFKSYRFVSYETKTIRELFLDPWDGMILGELTREQWVAEIIEASEVMRENLN